MKTRKMFAGFVFLLCHKILLSLLFEFSVAYNIDKLIARQVTGCQEIGDVILLDDRTDPCILAVEVAVECFVNLVFF